MSYYTPNIAESAVFKALGDFLVAMFPAIEVVRGIQNRVPPPAGPHIVMTPLGMTRLSVASTEYSDPDGHPELGAQDVTQPTRESIQVDFYGTGSHDRAAVFFSAFQTGWGFDMLPVTVKPLYTSEPRMLPLTTGEEQWIERWEVDAEIQYNPTTALPQQFADELEVNNITQANP